MSDKYNDIGDNEIRVLGGGAERISPMPAAPAERPNLSVATRILKYVAIVVGTIGLLLLLYFVFQRPKTKEDLLLPEPGYFDTLVAPAPLPSDKFPLARAAEMDHGFIELADTIINDIPMRLYLPHHVSMSLYLGAVDRSDSTILFATQAADVRADNGGIVGAFVMEGEPLAWGRSKKGFCAIINDTVTVGVAENSPLFEEATEKEGYFFRQFPLVDNGQIVENELKGKNLRRALCDRNGEIFIVETLTAESLHDFAQALADLGVDHAVYLVGGIAYGWATDAQGQRHEFGNPDPPQKKWENISYLVMRSKE